MRFSIPQPQELREAVTALFNKFKEFDKDGHLFTKQGRQSMDSVLRVVRRGYVSDPPGYDMYYQVGKDKTVFCCTGPFEELSKWRAESTAFWLQVCREAKQATYNGTMASFLWI